MHLLELVRCATSLPLDATIMAHPGGGPPPGGLSKQQRRRWRVWQIFPHRLCSYCGIKPATTFDHVNPKFWFEPHMPGWGKGVASADNLVPACDRCNNRKANATLLMFLWRRANLAKNRARNERRRRARQRAAFPLLLSAAPSESVPASLSPAPR